MSFDFTIEDNSKKFLKELDDRTSPALEECGLAAEGYAKRLCQVDTGLLRNSITHAVSGGSPAIKTYHAQYGSNRNDKGKRISSASKDAGAVGFGAYSGTAPEESGDKKSVYIGTNVEYAPYVEMGTKNHPTPQPFIEPAVTDHQKEYKGILERWMEGQ